MPVARFEMPDGRIGRFEVPEGTTPEQAQELIQAQVQGGPTSQPAPRPDSFMDDTVDVIAELAASANRSVTEFIDFVGPDSVNAILRLSGSDKQMPTLTGALESTGIQGGFMEPGTARDIVRGAGPAVTAGGGLVPVTRNVAKIGGALAEFAGVGAAKAVPGAAKVYTALEDVTPKIGTPTEKGVAKKRVEHDVLSGRTNADNAGFTLNEAGKVVKSKKAKKVVRQGFEPGIVSMINGASKSTRQKLLAKINIVAKGKKDPLYRINNRPSNVTGASIVERVGVVQAVKRMAGKRIDSVSEGLKGQYVDFSPAVDDFLRRLRKAGVKFSPENQTVSFKGSIFEDIPDPTGAIKRVLSRMLKAGADNDTKIPDAYDMHMFKRYIDENVSYGVNPSGLKGNAVIMLKKLRADMDGILDKNFPEYDAVNKQYSESVNALDEIQQLAGKKNKISGTGGAKVLGTLARSKASKIKGQERIESALNNLDALAIKYTTPGGGKAVVPYKKVISKAKIRPEGFNDSIDAQIVMDNELNRLFGDAAETSLGGHMDTAVDRAGRAAKSGAKATAVEVGVEKLKKMTGIDEEHAIEALRELLKESN